MTYGHVSIEDRQIEFTRKNHLTFGLIDSEEGVPFKTKTKRKWRTRFHQWFQSVELTFQFRMPGGPSQEGLPAPCMLDDRIRRILGTFLGSEGNQELKRHCVNQEMSEQLGSLSNTRICDVSVPNSKAEGLRKISSRRTPLVLARTRRRSIKPGGGRTMYMYVYIYIHV